MKKFMNHLFKKHTAEVILIAAFLIITVVVVIHKMNAQNSNWEPVGLPDFSNGQAQFVSLALDSNGTPYVAYVGKSIRPLASTIDVMEFSNSSWVSVGAPISVPIGGILGHIGSVSFTVNNDIPYLAYSAELEHPGVCIYGRPPHQNSGPCPPTFNTEVLDFSGSAGWEELGSPITDGYVQYISLAIYSGVPYMAYEDGANGDEVTVIEFNNSTWGAVGGAIPNGSAGYISLAIHNGTPYVAYTDWSSGNKLTVMEFDGTSWNTVGTKGFSAGGVDYVSLAIDSAGIPYVAYEDENTPNDAATVMKFNGSIWVSVGNPGFSVGGVFYTSITVHNGIPYVAYADETDDDAATVMKYNGSNWTLIGSPDFSGGEADFTSLAIDSTGNLYVSYEDYANSQGATVMEFGVPSQQSTTSALSVSTNGITSGGSTNGSNGSCKISPDSPNCLCNIYPNSPRCH